jgi:hypothetical protein
MRSLLWLALAGLVNTPSAASDFDLMVGLRSTIASYIRDGGYACSDVMAIDPVGYEDTGSVMRVVCRTGGGTRDGRRGDSTIFRVTAYPEGDFLAKPWTDAPNERLRREEGDFLAKPWTDPPGQRVGP